MTPTAVEEIDYLEEGAGPGVVELPEFAPAELPPASGAEEAPQYPGWDQETIEQFLLGTGAGIHMLAGKAEKDWLMTEKDLERIGPPLTRICNRYEPTLRLSPIADPLLVAHGFALYGWRSALERQRARRDEEDEPAAGAGDGYERGPAEEEEIDFTPNGLATDRYFDQGDSRG